MTEARDSYTDCTDYIVLFIYSPGVNIEGLTLPGTPSRCALETAGGGRGWGGGAGRQGDKVSAPRLWAL